eukprot:gene632-8135_t
MWTIQQPYNKHQIEYVHKLHKKQLPNEENDNMTYIFIGAESVPTHKLIIYPKKLTVKTWNLIYDYLFGQKISLEKPQIVKDVLRASIYLGLKKLSKQLLNLIVSNEDNFEKDYIDKKGAIVKSLSADNVDLPQINQVLFQRYGDKKVVKSEPLEDTQRTIIKKEKVVENNLKRKRQENYQEKDEKIRKIELENKELTSSNDELLNEIVKIKKDSTQKELKFQEEISYRDELIKILKRDCRMMNEQLNAMNQNQETIKALTVENQYLYSKIEKDERRNIVIGKI